MMLESRAEFRSQRCDLIVMQGGLESILKAIETLDSISGGGEGHWQVCFLRKFSQWL